MLCEISQTGKEIQHDLTRVESSKTVKVIEEIRIMVTRGQNSSAGGGNGKYWSKGDKFQFCKMNEFESSNAQHGDYSYSSQQHCVVYLKFAKRVNLVLSFPTPTHKWQTYDVMDTLISLIVVSFFKYIHFRCADFTSIKVKKYITFFHE